jgi:hypothetical protein
MSAIEINNEVSEEVKVFNNTDQKKEQRAMDRRLAFIKTRHRKLVEEGKLPAPESRLAKVDDEVNEMVKLASSVKQETTRLPFLTGVICPRKEENKKHFVKLNESWLQEMAARHGLDPDHLRHRTMEDILEIFKKLPEPGYENQGSKSDGIIRDSYDNVYHVSSRNESRQTSGGSDIGDGVR